MNKQLRRLYEVSNKYRVLFDRMADSVNDEWHKEDLEAITALADSTEEEAINLSAEIKNLEAEAEMVKNAKREMDNRQASLENFAEYLRGKLTEILVDNDIKAITSSPMFAIRLKKNPPGVQVLDEDLIPDEYYKEKITLNLDKTLIKSDIEAGRDVPGAMLSSKIRVEIK